MRGLDLSMSLNVAQQAAVRHRNGPLLVLAGAGTGKTRVITHRVAALLGEGVPAWRILAVTFTNKAAAEMRHRIEHLCSGEHDVSQLWVGTFHSICARILRRHGSVLGLSSRFTIYDPGDQSSVMGRILKELNVSDKMFTPRGVLGHIDRAKNRGLGPQDLDALSLVEPVRSVVRKAYERYQERLRAADAVDFGDLLMRTVELLRVAEQPKEGQDTELDPVRGFARRFLQVVVDEFQDTNPIQAELVDRLAGRADLCVVGDDDQSIYGWRGADVDHFLSFADRHRGAEIIRLEQNYRSTMNILRSADAVIRKNHRRLGKTLWSEAGDGERVRVLMLGTERDEARFIAREIRDAIDEGANGDEIAVFYRAHAQSRVLEDEIRRVGLACKIVGGIAFYERLEIKDILSYLAVLLNPHSDAHLLRILNRPTRGIGSSSQTKLVELAASRGVSLWTVLCDPSETGLSKAAARKISAFVAMIEELRERSSVLRADQIVLQVIQATGYREMLAADDSDEAADRLENLQELLGNVAEFIQEAPSGTLEEYLEVVSLTGGERTDGLVTASVSLMTVHSAKGLEFERVYLTGMEERVFPHARVLDSAVELEEERRLAYVALTRAKRDLTLTMAAKRRIYGQVQVGQPSRFLLDLPKDAIQTIARSIAAPPPASIPAPKAAPAREAWRDDIVYEPHEARTAPEDDASPDAIASEGVHPYVGMMVRHPTLGPAEVLGWSGEGTKVKLQLRFSTREVRTILARFVAPL